MTFRSVLGASHFLVVLISLLFYQGISASNTKDVEVCQTKVCQESARFLMDSMDASVNPCDDFYKYACGGWIEKHPIPKGRRSFSMTADLNDEVSRELAGLLKNATNENHPKAVLDAARLFQGCIDTETRESKGVIALQNVVNSLGGFPMIDPQWISTNYVWHKEVAKLRRLGLQSIIGVVIMDDDEVGSNQRLIGLSIPERDLGAEYLTNQTSKVAQKTVTYFKNYMVSTIKLMNPSMNETSLKNAVDEIIELEASLVKELEPLPEDKEEKEEEKEEESLLGGLISFIDYLTSKISGGSDDESDEESEESEPTNTFNISDVQRITENGYFRWTDFLNEVLEGLPQVSDETEIAVQSLAYLKHVVEVLHNTDARIVANYLGWVFLKNFGLYATKAFRDNEARFLRTYNEGEVEDLEETCVEQVTGAFEFAVGRLYVDKCISEEDVRETVQLVEDVRSAYEVNFNHIDWMDAETREKAIEKLRYMVHFVGYPEWIKNDSAFNSYYGSVHNVRQDDYLESYVRVKTAAEGIKLGLWNKPVSRATEWPSGMTIVEVNAQYDPSRNTISLPAAIFNVPIYKRGTVPALNYAGFGSYIAHEITHGFDSQGHKFDKEGNQISWWSEETKQKFEEKAECIKQQYSKIVEPMTNTSLREEETLPDDIADNGAVRNAFMAYEMQVIQGEERQRKNMGLPGLSLTPEQLYFLGLASMECSHHTKKSMKWTIENDDHSPAEYRVRVPLRNSRAFSEAFNCPVGAPMNPAKKCQLW